MERITFNIAGSAKRVTSGGREFLIAPATLIVPGVLNGSKGALFYPPSEIRKSAARWSNVPLTVYHPHVLGQPASAKDSDVLNRQGCGLLRRTFVDQRGRLKGECWFDVDQTRRVSPRVLSMLEQGQPIELSTGLFTENTPAPTGATYNGRPYDFVAREYTPDHLAILPDQVGACSLQDGCGVLVNSQKEKVVMNRPFLAPKITEVLAAERRAVMNGDSSPFAEGNVPPDSGSEFRPFGTVPSAADQYGEAPSIMTSDEFVSRYVTSVQTDSTGSRVMDEVPRPVGPCEQLAAEARASRGMTSDDWGNTSF